MKFMVLVLALGYVTTTEGSIHELPVHPGVGGLYRGPNSETIIKGPDGSVITAEAEGGAIHIQDTLEPIVVAEPDVVSVSAAPIVDVSAVVAPAVPLAHTIEIVQPDPHIIETEIVDAPVLEPQQSSDLIGPSGSISIRGSSSVVSGPASTTISEPARILVAAPVPVVASVTTPLLAAPVVDVIPDLGALSHVTVGPPVLSASISPISTTGPPSVWDSGKIFPSTIVPPITSDLGLNQQISPQLTLSTPAPIAIPSLLANSANLGEIVNIDQPAALVKPASSNGVVNNIGNTVQFSSTIGPELSVSSTLFPPIVPSQELLPPQVTQKDNRQLTINPSLIPFANIIPPEIGPLSTGTINLGTTVTVSSTPRAPGLYSSSESPNIQRQTEVDRVVLDNDIRNSDERFIDSRLGQFAENSGRSAEITGLFNQPERSGINVPLLRDTVPIQRGIYQSGLIGAQLTKYGIDASQINLSDVPLSSVTPLSDNTHLAFGVSQNIEDPSSVLWNRYGRDVNHKEN